MRKLKLDLDELRVDTLTAEERTPGVGTVRGNMPVDFPATDDTSGDGGGSGHQTCQKSCDVTCTLFGACTAFTCYTVQYCCT